MSSGSRVLRVVFSAPVRVLVTAVLLVLVGLAIDWTEIANVLLEGRWELFVVAVGLLVAGLVVGALRWHALLWAADVEVSFWGSLRAYAIGTFSNMFLPQLGGDAARAWLVARSGSRLARSAASVVVDRVSALGCLLALGWICVLVDAPSIPAGLILALLSASALYLVCCVVALTAGFRARGRVAAIIPARARPYISEAVGAVRGYARNGRLTSEVALLGMLYQVIVVLAAWILAEAIRVDVSFAALAVVLPVVLIATLVPISLGGFGVREGGFVVLLSEVGVGASDAALLSLLTYAALALASLPGALAIMLPNSDRDRLRQRDQPEGLDVSVATSAAAGGEGERC